MCSLSSSWETQSLKASEWSTLNHCSAVFHHIPLPVGGMCIWCLLAVHNIRSQRSAKNISDHSTGGIVSRAFPGLSWQLCCTLLAQWAGFVISCDVYIFICTLSIICLIWKAGSLIYFSAMPLWLPFAAYSCSRLKFSTAVCSWHAKAAKIMYDFTPNMDIPISTNFTYSVKYTILCIHFIFLKYAVSLYMNHCTKHWICACVSYRCLFEVPSHEFCSQGKSNEKRLNFSKQSPNNECGIIQSCASESVKYTCSRTSVAHVTMTCACQLLHTFSLKLVWHRLMSCPLKSSFIIHEQGGSVFQSQCSVRVDLVVKPCGLALGLAQSCCMYSLPVFEWKELFWMTLF